MRRPLLAAAAGAAALGLSIPIALLGRAVLAAPDRAEPAAITWPPRAHVEEHRSLFERAADGLIGADRPDELFAIMRGYRQAVSEPVAVTDSAKPVRLARLAREIGPASERSQAHVMAGAAFALPAGRGTIGFDRMRQIGGGRLLAQAEAELREAAVLDEGNEAAKYDLELMLKSKARSLPSRSTSRGTKQAKRLSTRSKQAGNDVKRPRTRRKLHGGGVYGTGKGY